MELPLAISAFEWLENAVRGEVWTYPAIVVAVAFDSLFPIAPGEAVVITAGVLAADGGLNPFLVVCAGIAGGCLGDSCSYWLGASLGRRAERRLFKSEKARGRVETGAVFEQKRWVVLRRICVEPDPRSTFSGLMPCFLAMSSPTSALVAN